MYFSCTAMRLRGVLCSFLLLKIGSSVQKDCGIYALQDDIRYFCS